MIIVFGKSRFVLVTEPDVDSKLAVYANVVLKIAGIVADILVELRRGVDVTAGRIPQQYVGEIGPGSSGGLGRILPREYPAKVEQAGSVGQTDKVHVDQAIIRSEGNAVASDEFRDASQKILGPESRYRGRSCADFVVY